MTLREYRVNELGWSVSKLASEAGVSRQVISSAEKGGGVHAETAKALAGALSRGLKRDIKPLDIEGLNIF
jgi:transcriptional regulator with XRE-family HTH domain